MSRIVSAFVVSASLLFVGAGCAVAPEDDEGDGEAPAVVEGSVETNAAGMSCVCPAGQQFQNGLCYPACAAGYTGEGPVCWQNCASGFTDTGFFCHRDSRVIGADTSRCPWYNKCGWSSDCNRCPAGYINDGCTCRIDAYIYAQPSYGRGAGTTPSCSTY
jgi:hypothetical protein